MACGIMIELADNKPFLCHTSLSIRIIYPLAGVYYLSEFNVKILIVSHYVISKEKLIKVNCLNILDFT